MNSNKKTDVAGQRTRTIGGRITIEHVLMVWIDKFQCMQMMIAYFLVWSNPIQLNWIAASLDSECSLGMAYAFGNHIFMCTYILLAALIVSLLYLSFGWYMLATL